MFTTFTPIALRRSLAAVALVAGVSIVASSPIADATRRPVTTTRVLPLAQLPAGARIVSALPATRPVSFDMVLAVRNASAFANLVSAVTTPSSPLYRHYLSKGAFAKDFGATATTIRTVTSSLVAQGLHVDSVSSNHVLVHASGPAASVDRYFATSLHAVRLASGRFGMMAVTAPRLPRAVASSVTSVLGLNVLSTVTGPTGVTNGLRRPSALGNYRTFARPHQLLSAAGAPTACQAAIGATQQGYGGITDDQISQAYGVDSLYNQGDYGAGQTIGILELEPYLTSDVQQFDNCYFGADHTGNITNVAVDGGAGVGPGSGESALDVDNVEALAPAANVMVYSGPQTLNGQTDVYNQMVADDQAQQITSSWGYGCESSVSAQYPGLIAADHLIFEEAAAQGQTIFVASGDEGNDGCAYRQSTPTTPVLGVGYPQSDPYVVSVGGTTAVTVTAQPVQQTWNDGANGGASGGGVSSIFGQPGWMPQTADPSNGTSCGLVTACRTIPDVSAFADEYTGVTIVYNGQWGTIGGTSSAAPQWAAFLAEVNASPVCSSQGATQNGVGFASPLLYGVAHNATDAVSSFEDITTGNNDTFSATGGMFPALPGYDLATGLGTPNLTAPTGVIGPGLAASLCSMADASGGLTVTGASPSVVAITGGTTVSVGGSGFLVNGKPAVQAVYFGATPDYNVTVVSNNLLTVVSPGVQNDVTSPAVGGVTAGTGAEAITVLGLDGAVSTSPSSGAVVEHFVAPLGTPLVTQVGPYGGPASGGNIVRILGSGFTGATALTFGGLPATSFTVENDSMISAVAPSDTTARCLSERYASLGLCQVQVVVTGATGATSPTAPIYQPLTGTPSFTSAGLPATPRGCQCEGLPSLTEYDYGTASLTGVENVTTLSPSGSPLGGDVVQITGTGLNALTENFINWGDPSAGTSADFSSFYFSPDGHEILARSLPVLTPSGQVSTVNVSVNTVAGNTNAVTWSYRAEPFVSSVSTAVLPSAGGTLVTLTGSGFSSATKINVVNAAGGINPPTSLYASNFQVVNDSTLQFTSPSLVPGDYAFSVCSSDGVCNESTSQSTQPSADNVIVVYPGEEAVTSVTDPSTGPGLAVVGTSSDQLLVQGVGLSSATDIVLFVTKGGDIAAQGVIEASSSPTDAGADSAYLVAAPAIAGNVNFGPLSVVVFNTVTNAVTPLNSAATVLYQ